MKISFGRRLRTIPVRPQLRFMQYFPKVDGAIG
nr:MAG TPA: hypothetical protein [Caudoviricetes sp.]